MQVVNTATSHRQRRAIISSRQVNRRRRPTFARHSATIRIASSCACPGDSRIMINAKCAGCTSTLQPCTYVFPPRGRLWNPAYRTTYPPSPAVLCRRQEEVAKYSTSETIESVFRVLQKSGIELQRRRLHKIIERCAAHEFPLQKDWSKATTEAASSCGASSPPAGSRAWRESHARKCHLTRLSCRAGGVRQHSPPRRCAYGGRRRGGRRPCRARARPRGASQRGRRARR